MNHAHSLTTVLPRHAGWPFALPLWPVSNIADVPLMLRKQCRDDVFGTEHKYLFSLFSLYSAELRIEPRRERWSGGGYSKRESMQRTVATPVKNRLLAGLPRVDSLRLSQYLEPVSLDFGQVLYEPGDRIRHVYFPYGSVISLLSVVGVNKAAEVAVVGNEGLVGGSAALGINVSHLRAVVQVAGSAARISASRMRAEFETHGSWNPELFRFTHSLMNQVAQTAACNRFHKVEARLARWLLAIRDRVRSQHFHVTHEFLSLMLGVRRVGVTAAATNLQKRALISYTRGNIQLLNSAGLEACACECYVAVKAMYRRDYRT